MLPGAIFVRDRLQDVRSVQTITQAVKNFLAIVAVRRSKGRKKFAGAGASAGPSPFRAVIAFLAVFGDVEPR
jgi:hypothetical protein